MKKLAGFSLLEVVVVLGIITIILGMTTAYFFNYKSGAALKVSSQNVIAALNQARSLAITTKAEHGVAFDTADSVFRIYEKIDNSRQWKSVWMKTADGVIIESTTLPVDSNSTINKPAAIFNINGSAESNASIYLKNSYGKYYTLTIINATGRIREYNYQR
jgi:Tfp pilus assembly protein FimT